MIRPGNSNRSTRSKKNKIIRIAIIGSGPTSFARKKVTIEGLARAIQKAVTDKAMHLQVADFEEKIQAMDGLARAVGIIQQTQQGEVLLCHKQEKSYEATCRNSLK